jgi:hypothetical protein
MDISAISRSPDGPSVRAVLRVVVTVIVSLLAVYLMYVLRQPPWPADRRGVRGLPRHQ